MRPEELLDKYAGCLVGIAAGDAYGMPAADLSPYLVWSKFQQIDAFYPSKGRPAGSYTGVTQLALVEAVVLAKNEGLPDPEASKRALLDIAKQGKNRWGPNDYPLRCIPAGLVAAASPIPDKQLLANCIKTCSVSKRSKKEIIASFCLSWCAKELIRNGKAMSNVQELCLSDLSMMGRLVKMCQAIENKFDPLEEDRLSKRLAYVRHKVDAGTSFEEMAGTLGNSWDVMESVPFSLFCFLQSSDDAGAIKQVATLGGAAPLNSAIVGGLIGAYTGARFMPTETRNLIEGSARIIAVAKKLAVAALGEDADNS